MIAHCEAAKLLTLIIIMTSLWSQNRDKYFVRPETRLVKPLTGRQAVPAPRLYLQAMPVLIPIKSSCKLQGIGT